MRGAALNKFHKFQTQSIEIFVSPFFPANYKCISDIRYSISNWKKINFDKPELELNSSGMANDMPSKKKNDSIGNVQLKSHDNMKFYTIKKSRKTDVRD